MKKTAKSKAKELLTEAGLRQTAPRISILCALLKADRPLSRRQVSKILGLAAPDKVTIYRTFESLIEAGLVHRAYLRKRAWHFELANNCTEQQCHPHFTCTDCGRTHCLPQLSFPMAKSPDKGFVIARQRVQLEGLCPVCNPNA